MLEPALSDLEGRKDGQLKAVQVASTNKVQCSISMLVHSSPTYLDSLSSLSLVAELIAL